MGQFIDRSGRRYGRLLVVKRVDVGPASQGRRVKWLCLCDCGSEKVATGHELAAGHTRSCGCLQRETVGEMSRTHGQSKRSGAYSSWAAAKARCYNPKHNAYRYYGGAGITMCERWQNSFEAFFEDMGPRPKGMTLDRLDQTKGYEPGNVRWATHKEQSENRGNIRAFRWKGQWMTRKAIAEMERIPYTSLVKAIRKTNTIQAAVQYVRDRLGRKGLDNLYPPKKLAA